jgi:ribose transport system substrate-binding protein
VVVLAIVALLLTACGSSDDPDASQTPVSSEGIADAEQAIEDARAVPEFTDPGPAFDTSEADGKEVFVIVQSLAIPFDKAWSDALTEALGRAGVETVIAESGANPAEIPRLVQQAIGRGVDQIVIEGIPTEAISEPLQSARDAGIPVVKLFDHDPQLPSDDTYAAQVSYCFSCAGKLLADWSVVKGDGQVNAMVYWNTGPSSGPIINAAMEAEYEKVCPETCSVTFKEMLISDWSTFDGMLTYMAPPLRQTEGVHAASFNSDLPIMEMLQDGDVVEALVGSPVEWMGWAIADQSLRVMTGNEPVASENVALRVFDETNIDSIDLAEPESEWYGVDFVTEYLRLWQLAE